MCLSAAEVYSVKVTQRQRGSLRADDRDIRQRLGLWWPFRSRREPLPSCEIQLNVEHLTVLSPALGQLGEPETESEPLHATGSRRRAGSKR